MMFDIKDLTKPPSGLLDLIDALMDVLDAFDKQDLQYRKSALDSLAHNIETVRTTLFNRACT